MSWRWNPPTPLWSSFATKRPDWWRNTAAWLSHTHRRCVRSTNAGRSPQNTNVCARPQMTKRQTAKGFGLRSNAIRPSMAAKPDVKQVDPRRRWITYRRTLLLSEHYVRQALIIVRKENRPSPALEWPLVTSRFL